MNMTVAQQIQDFRDLHPEILSVDMEENDKCFIIGFLVKNVRHVFYVDKVDANDLENKLFAVYLKDVKD